MTTTSRLFHAGVCCKSPTRTDVIHAAVANCCCRPAWLPRQCSLAGCGAGAIRCRGFTRGVAQLGSALRSGRRGRGFESRHPDNVLAVSRPSMPATQIAAAYPVRFSRQFRCCRWQLTVATPPSGAGPERLPRHLGQCRKIGVSLQRQARVLVAEHPRKCQYVSGSRARWGYPPGNETACTAVPVCQLCHSGCLAQLA